MAQYAHLSTPDPELKAALAQFANIILPTDIQGLRKIAADSAEEISFPQSQLKVQDWKVPVQAGEILVRTYIPQQDIGQTNPLLVWAHGGGFATGGLSTDDAILQKLAIDLKLSVVNVDYRLAPEFPFPIGLNDTYEALKWAYKNSQSLEADPAKGFFLGGCSAGGNFTAVLAHRARDDPDLRGRLTGQILQVPMVVHKDVVPEKYKDEILSLEQNRDAPLLDLKSMQIYLDNYGCTNLSDPNLSPIYWSSHRDLPPAYLQICGLDPLRDEGLLYEKLLNDDGVKTKLHIYPGLPHSFERLFPASAKQTAKWNEDLREGIKWLLRGAGDA